MMRDLAGARRRARPEQRVKPRIPDPRLLLQAREFKHGVHAKQVGVLADCKTLGSTFGAGIGLYFRIIGWWVAPPALPALPALPAGAALCCGRLAQGCSGAG